MGFTERISWSHSRAKARGECPRAYFWTYFAKGEPEVRRANILKKLSNIDMLVGQAVDWAISATLEQYQKDERTVDGLVDRGVKTFNRLLEWSPSTCEWMKKGKYPANEAQPLHHDYYGIPLRDGKVEECRVKVAKCLANFKSSELLDQILSVHPSRWSPPKGDSVPSFRIPNACTVYANYDFYARLQSDELLIVDWKAGAVSKEADKEAEAQLSVYGLYGVYALKYKPEQVKVVAAWLQVATPWIPTTPTFERQKATHDRILKEWKAETDSLVLDAGERKTPVWIADRADYPPKPERFQCRKCKFREICPEGRAVIEGT